MRCDRRGLGAGLIGLVGACLFLTGRFGVGGDMPERRDGSFLQVGPYYINADRILYAFAEGGGVVVVLGSGQDGRLKLDGTDADAMRRWLDTRSAGGRLSDPLGPQPRRTLGPGDNPARTGTTKHS